MFTLVNDTNDKKIVALEGKSFLEVLGELIGYHTDLINKDNSLTVARRQGNKTNQQTKATSLLSPFDSFIRKVNQFGFRGLLGSEIKTLIDSNEIALNQSVIEDFAKSLSALMPSNDIKVSAMDAMTYLERMLELDKKCKFVRGMKFVASENCNTIEKLLIEAKADYAATILVIDAERDDKQEKFNSFWKRFGNDAMTEELTKQKANEQKAINNHIALTIAFGNALAAKV